MIDDVLATQEAFWVALKSKDRDAFEQVLAEDFVSRSPGEPDEERDDFIHTLTAFPARVLRIESDNLAVHTFADMAVLSAVQIAQMLFGNGEVIRNRIAITNVFRRNNDRWRMVFAHSVELPPEN